MKFLAAPTFGRTFSAALLLLPGMALAMGGEGIAADLLRSVAIVLVWLIACIASFFGKRRRFGGVWFAAWAVRLSVPLLILWGIHVDPLIEKAKDKERELATSAAIDSFQAACKAHAPQPQIVQVANTGSPKMIFIDEVDLFGPEITYRFVGCLLRSSPACQGLKVEAVEWALHHSSGFRPCEAGPDPQRPGQCLPEFHRTTLDAGRAQVASIDKPMSEYRIRVRQEAPAVKEDQVRRFQVTLESMDTKQVLARSELLMSWVSPPCQDVVAEVSSMLTHSFSGR